MIVINNIEELCKYKNNIRKFKSSNFQHTYENIYSIFLSNKTAIAFLDWEMVTVFIEKDKDIYECPLNIEPIINMSSSIEKVKQFINNIQSYLDRTLYFPLVYEDSKFYKNLKKNLYTYKRLYTSVCNFKKIDNIINKVLSSKNVHYSNRNVKKFEKNLYIKYYTKIDPSNIIVEIEKESWKYEAKQDMITKKEQLLYYSSLVESGIANIAVSYMKENDEIVSYRIEAINNNKIHVLKNSYKEKYKKYSPGSYMLISDLYNNYKNNEYIDLYGGPSLAKDMIETKKVNRYDMLIGNINIIKTLEEKRKKWDEKNYNNFMNDNSIKKVFDNKPNILAVTSCFGLGPVGKLSAIVDASKDTFNWFAAGEEFDINIFNNKNIFIDKCFTMDEEIIKSFLSKYNIKYALVVLKNKMAKLLFDLGIKVIYVDSLPFMWSLEDANSGKVPYYVDCYCAQKTIELSDLSTDIFSKVQNLVWVNPIINNKNKKTSNIKGEYILINIGGLHSPSTNGNDYTEIVLKNIVDYYSNEKIIITTSQAAAKQLSKYFRNYENVIVKTLNQNSFYDYINGAKIFMSSPGLTTILESCNITNKIIFLPPQNISQFYNVEYGKTVFKYYKEMTWNNSDLTLEKFKKCIDQDEHEIIKKINKGILKIRNSINKNKFDTYIKNVLDSSYIENRNLHTIKFNGAAQVVENIKKVMEE